MIASSSYRPAYRHVERYPVGEILVSPLVALFWATVWLGVAYFALFPFSWSQGRVFVLEPYHLGFVQALLMLVTSIRSFQLHSRYARTDEHGGSADLVDTVNRLEACGGWPGSLLALFCFPYPLHQGWELVALAARAVSHLAAWTLLIDTFLCPWHLRLAGAVFSGWVKSGLGG